MLDHKDIVIIVQKIAEKAESLVRRTISRELPISYVTIFSHNAGEYDRYIKLASELGAAEETNNGIKFVLKYPIQTVGGNITHIRVRKPDPYRSQIGCADAVIDDYATFKKEELPRHPENLRIPPHPTIEMIEFFDLNANDVLAYIVSK